MSANSDLNLARSVVRIERDALEKPETSLGAPLLEAVELILSTDRHVVIAGVGKSGQGANAGSPCGAAKRRFHGQACWKTSQPKTQSSICPRSSPGMAPLCSIVR